MHQHYKMTKHCKFIVTELRKRMYLVIKTSKKRVKTAQILTIRDTIRPGANSRNRLTGSEPVNRFGTG